MAKSDLAKIKKVSFDHSVGGIAIAVLNNGLRSLRPFLPKWQPLLQTWSDQRPSAPEF